jgi:hypothetical protein
MKVIDRKAIRVAFNDKIIGSDTGSLNASSTEAPCGNRLQNILPGQISFTAGKALPSWSWMTYYGKIQYLKNKKTWRF